ncbi:MAG: hypothetical protein DYG96_01340 [Chlorobi bacterium CHB2]|nr:hypothetical protein [Chlorobi bacterium CHB2]
MTEQKRLSLLPRVATFLLGTLCVANIAVAQQSSPVVDPNGHMGVGTTAPDQSAALDIVSTTGGLLIPRMTSAQRDQIPNPATGLLVFNTTTGNFEYNDGTPGTPVWETILNTSNLVNFGWSTTGNPNTNPSTNFLGTKDDVALVVRTNNIERMRVDNDGDVGVGTTGPNVRMDVDGGLAVRPSSEVSVSDGSTITVGNRSYIRASSTTDWDSTEVSLSDGVQDGQILVLQVKGDCDDGPGAGWQGGDASDGFVLSNANILAGSFSNLLDLLPDDVITLIWDASEEKWAVISSEDSDSCEIGGKIKPEKEEKDPAPTTSPKILYNGQ